MSIKKENLLVIPEGPWSLEPDFKLIKHAGLKGVVIRHPTMGHLLGYVQLPHGSLADKVHAKNLRLSSKIKGGKFRFLKKRRRQYGYDIPELMGLEVHGGITYGSRKNLCGIHYRMGRGIWVGFDCAHCDDLVPAFQTLKIISGEYADFNYVESHVRLLAEQVAKLPGAHRG